MTRKSPKNQIVLGLITALYVLSVIGGLIIWVDLNLLIGTSGESRSESLSAEFNAFSSPHNLLLVNLTQNLPPILADGLLIWRCFKIYNNSFRIIALSLLLFLAEIALYLTVTVLDGIPTIQLTVATHNGLISAALFTTLAVTLWTTSLIAYRIYSASTHILNGARPRFYNILEIIIQTSFIYSLTLVMNAVLAAIPPNQGNPWTFLTASNYIATIFLGVAGIAPTLMVARVALLSNSIVADTGETTIGVSAIQFGEQNPSPNAGEAVHSNSMSEGETSST
ncbi:hypothetical protein HYPSUDRAFT_44843 [Hypholoma sublateritium FD-334 SS-4]|uniref:Uncharacterized protein n=1 Tax=Hypholoma sublateritium (strain FD-334 SS-4) TaxID=945553 RepID=A0A0D2NQ01_HYPSF|nr:hypothetical protein HYPSUDRAFT_44843 [Hypholoma sublateritium FD-334 SS-4]